jgi:hypothetical protein
VSGVGQTALAQRTHQHLRILAAGHCVAASAAVQGKTLVVDPDDIGGCGHGRRARKREQDRR